MRYEMFVDVIVLTQKVGRYIDPQTYRSGLSGSSLSYYESSICATSPFDPPPSLTRSIRPFAAA